MDKSICPEFPRMLNIWIYTISQTKILKCVHLYGVKYVHLTKPDNYYKDRKLDSGNMILHHRENARRSQRRMHDVSIAWNITRVVWQGWNQYVTRPLSIHYPFCRVATADKKRVSQLMVALTYVVLRWSKNFLNSRITSLLSLHRFTIFEPLYFYDADIGSMLLSLLSKHILMLTRVVVVIRYIWGGGWGGAECDSGILEIKIFHKKKHRSGIHSIRRFWVLVINVKHTWRLIGTHFPVREDQWS